MKHVVSVSIGSSDRDHSVVADILGEQMKIERIGTDGDEQKAVRMIKDLDGKVDAIGLGGIDLYLVAGKRRYMIRDAKKLADAAKKTPVYDGSGLKNTLERKIIRDLAADGKYLKKGTKVLMPGSVDRFGMAEALAEAKTDVIYADFYFSLNMKLPVRDIHTMHAIAYVLLPIFTKVPFKLLYPTGSAQKERKPRFPEQFAWAEVIAGDFHFIRRYMPEDMTGKVVITNTVTRSNVEELKKMGCRTLITTTPDFEGRSFGTNVLEGVLSAHLGKKRGQTTSEKEYLDLIAKLGLRPNVIPLNE